MRPDTAHDPTLDRTRGLRDRARRLFARAGRLAGAAGVLALAALVGACAGGGPGEGPSTVETTLASGTGFTATLGQQLSTRDNQEGDTFTLTVAEDVTREGRVVIPGGSTVNGEVTAVQESGSSSETAVIKVDFTSVEVRGQTHPLSARLTSAEPQQESRTSTGEGAAQIGAATAAGAIIGRILGGDATGAVVGGAVGAAAGTAVVLGTRDVDAVLPAGSPIGIALTEPITLEVPVEEGSGEVDAG